MSIDSVGECITCGRLMDLSEGKQRCSLCRGPVKAMVMYAQDNVVHYVKSEEELDKLRSSRYFISHGFNDHGVEVFTWRSS